jgi:hypothetical protein
VTPGWQGDPLAGYGAPVKINLITCLFLELKGSLGIKQYGLMSDITVRK